MDVDLDRINTLNDGDLGPVVRPPRRGESRTEGSDAQKRAYRPPRHFLVVLASNVKPEDVEVLEYDSKRARDAALERLAPSRVKIYIKGHRGRLGIKPSVLEED